MSALSLQFRNRRAAGKNQVGPPGKIGNRDLPGVNAEVAVNRRQKIAGRAHPRYDFFTTLVRSTNHASSLDTTAGPKIGEGARPVVAPRLDGSRRCWPLARCAECVQIHP